VNCDGLLDREQKKLVGKKGTESSVGENRTEGQKKR